MKYEDIKMNSEITSVVTVETMDNGTLELHVKKTIGLQEMLEFVKFIVDTCIDNTDGSFLPEARDFAFRRGVLEYYAGFEEPEDIDLAYRVVYYGDLFDNIVTHIDYMQLCDIERAADRQIDHMLALNTAMATKETHALLAKVDDLMNTLGDMTKGITDPDMLESMMEILSVIAPQAIKQDKKTKTKKTGGKKVVVTDSDKDGK